MTPDAFNEEQILAIWGKSNKNEPDNFHPLVCHLIDVAAVCWALLPRFGVPPGLSAAWTIYLVALHDIGKASPYFQVKDLSLGELMSERTGLCLVEPEEGRGFRHEARSAQYISDSILRPMEWGARAIDTVRLAINGHHGDFRAFAAKEREYEAAQWNSARDQISVELFKLFRVEKERVDRFRSATATGTKLAGLIVLSDWIASNDELFPYFRRQRNVKRESMVQYYGWAKREARKIVKKMGLQAQAPSKPPKSFTAIWPGISYLTPVQTAVERVCLDGSQPGLMIVEAPMGQGKTEAAIFVAEYWNALLRQSGAYIALPTQATSNQMYSRYSEFLKHRRPGVNVRLIHGMAWLLDDDANFSPPDVDGADDLEGLRAQEWFANSKRALIAPEGVGTVDQAMTAALHVKHGFLRLLGLTGRTLIIDEVHAYDDYMSTILERLLAYCRCLSIPVIMLSATLSSRQKARLLEAYSGSASDEDPAEAEYPLITCVDTEGLVTRTTAEPGDTKTYEVRRHAGLLNDPDRTATLAINETRSGGCACIIANTVVSAQEIYRRLVAKEPKDTRLMLFHARFTAERRQIIEHDVVKSFGKPETGRPDARPKRAILVATQVVEQSLDVDFDVMISQIAPIDLLLQRLGRLWRQSIRDASRVQAAPCLHVLLPDEGTYIYGGTERVYFRELLLRTQEIIESRDELKLPGDFRPLIEECYREKAVRTTAEDNRDLVLAALARSEKNGLMRDEAARFLVPEPKPGEFSYASSPNIPNDEGEEGEKTSWFRASTRYGSDTRSVVLLGDPFLIEAAKRAERPTMELMRKILLQKVSLPAWWFSKVDIQAQEEDMFEPDGWLRHNLVIALSNGRWRGTAGGTDVTFTSDPIVGVYCMAEEY